jgi:DUF917 family protein
VFVPPEDVAPNNVPAVLEVAGYTVAPPPDPPVELMTPLLIVIVDPSTLTPPSTAVVAVGNEYGTPASELITPVLLIVIVAPSIFTPPITVWDA